MIKPQNSNREKRKNFSPGTYFTGWVSGIWMLIIKIVLQVMIMVTYTIELIKLNNGNDAPLSPFFE